MQLGDAATDFGPGTSAKKAGSAEEAAACCPTVSPGPIAALRAERDHYRDLVEKVGVVKALRDLVAAAEPLCGKLEVIPGRVKLPPEYYPAAWPAIGTLREAVAAAKAVLSDE